MDKQRRPASCAPAHSRGNKTATGTVGVPARLFNFPTTEPPPGTSLWRDTLQYRRSSVMPMGFWLICIYRHNSWGSLFPWITALMNSCIFARWQQYKMINSDFRNIIMNNLILSGFPATKIQNLIENLLIMFKRQIDVLQLLLSPLANRIKTNLTRDALWPGPV